MSENPLRKVEMLGQSIWLDYIRRKLIESGELKRFIDEDGLSGLTSNPAIFEKAIGESNDYDEDLRKMATEGKSPTEAYEVLTVEDVRRVADLFREKYDRSGGNHGFVSLEVNPHLAHDAEGTVTEARRLWKKVDRPNALIKVPGTPEGLKAIRQLIGEGINVNVTLLFGLPRYGKVAEAYVQGLEDRVAKGESIEKVRSVASFFLSRIDVLVDPILEKITDGGGENAETARKLRGRVAIVSAKKAYTMYKGIFKGERFEELARMGAAPQRVLWASTSTKNPDYADVKYVEALIGPETVNTLPLETLEAYRDHGQPEPRLEDNMEEAEQVLKTLPKLGIDIDKVTRQLEDEGVDKFNKPYDKLLQKLEEKLAQSEEPAGFQEAYLGDLGEAVENRLAVMEKEKFVSRLWDKDGTLWSLDPGEGEEIKNSMGWLHLPKEMDSRISELEEFVRDVRSGGFTAVVHMGMGGSSLAPMVFERDFPRQGDGLALHVLDSTDPGAIRDIEKRIAPEKTLFIVASKSGTTAEPLAFGDYFYDKLRKMKGERAGEHFVAITDPDTPLVEQARERGFRKTFLNFKDIGGRYSALSYFGLVPAALNGLDVRKLLRRAQSMYRGCGSGAPIRENPAVYLGTILGESAKAGRDKVTFIAPATLATFGLWLEQLIAESTGKQGKGLLPVSGEPLGGPDLYGDDRIFVHLNPEGGSGGGTEKEFAALRDAGHPVVEIAMKNVYDLGMEFFRWELAVATAGSILAINPFDQPNVQAAKKNTNKLLDEVGRTGRLPDDEPTHTDGPLGVYSREDAESVGHVLAAFLDWFRPGDYAALLAYLQENEINDQLLNELRRLFRDTFKVAATVGYGPRYLHSTGQYHKGGPNTGVFLQLTSDHQPDLDQPGRPYTFGMLEHAQALGDMEALMEHGRRVLRVHFKTDVKAGLEHLIEMFKTALHERK